MSDVGFRMVDGGGWRGAISFLLKDTENIRSNFASFVLMEAILVFLRRLPGEA